MRPFARLLPVAILAATAMPASAGSPEIEHRLNVGDAGFVTAVYDVPSANDTGGTRTVQSDCAFVVLPSVDSNTADVLVTAHASAAAGATSGVYAAGTGVRCEVRTAERTYVVAVAQPGGTAYRTEVLTYRLSPVTLCTVPSVLWTDAVFDTGKATCA